VTATYPAGKAHAALRLAADRRHDPMLAAGKRPSTSFDAVNVAQSIFRRQRRLPPGVDVEPLAQPITIELLVDL